MRCATHPDVETNLSCSKCLKAICPRCAIETPVGLRCRECARLTKLPTFSISGLDYMKAAGAGLGSTIVSGFIWLVLRALIPYITFLNIFLAAAIGYGIGQAISLSIRRKRGRLLKFVASLFVLMAFVIGNQFTLSGHFIADFNLYNLIAIAAGIYLAISTL